MSNRGKAEEADINGYDPTVLVVAIYDRLQLGRKKMSVQYREIKPFAYAHVPIYVKTILQNRSLHDIFVLYQPFSRDPVAKDSPRIGNHWPYL